MEYRINDIKEGLKGLRKQLSSAESDVEKLRIYTAMGNSYILISDAEDTRDNILNAQLCFDEAGKIAERIGNSSELADIEELTGFAFFKLSFIENRNENLKLSMGHYLNALSLLGHENLEKYISVRYNLANVYLALRDGNEREYILKAIDILKEILEISKTLGRNQSTVTISNTLGTAYLLLSEITSNSLKGSYLESAMEFFNEALQHIEFEESPLDFASAHNGMGVSLMKIGDINTEKDKYYRDAITHLDMALKVYTPEASPSDFASTEYTLGICYFKIALIDPEHSKELLKKAENSLRQSLEIFDRDSSPKEFLKVEYDLSQVLRELYLITKDKKYLDECVERFKSTLTIVTEEKDPLTYATVNFLLGESLYLQGKLKDSLPYYLEAERVTNSFDPSLAKKISDVRKNIQAIQ